VSEDDLESASASATTQNILQLKQLVLEDREKEWKSVETKRAGNS